ncbi:hypothetical protein MCL26_08520 [Acinetobacter pittii]|uniref:hypothetical protein n=1 Tax=Acinetobacter pittii TaxID=48296 RepID=UPI001EFC4D83|nr:hypothetical protein [Acinetobacter pittii]
MDKIQVILTVIISLFVGGLIGAVEFSKSNERFEAVTTACVMTNEAVDKKILTTDQVKQLGELTGAKLEKDYPVVAKRFEVSPDILRDASNESNCNQFLVGFNSSN